MPPLLRMIIPPSGFGDTNRVGSCREMFLRDKAPTVLRELANGLGLVTTRCSCNYLAELVATGHTIGDRKVACDVPSELRSALRPYQGGTNADSV